MKEIRELVREARASIGVRGSLGRNISYMFGGKSLSLVISFLLTPVLSRIFDQEAFGQFGLYNTLVNLCALLVGLSLSESFILPMAEDRFRRTARATATLIVVGVVFLALVTALAGAEVFSGIGLVADPLLLMAFPVMVALYAADIFQTDHARRVKAFRETAAIGSFGQLLARVSGIAIGRFLDATYLGLTAKEVVRVVFTLLARWAWIFRKGQRFLPRLMPVREVGDVLRDQWRFPAYQLPANLVRYLVGSLPIVLAGRYFAPSQVGDLTMAMTMVNYPVFILSTSIISVYQPRAGELLREQPERLRKSTRWLFLLLLGIGSLGYGVVLWYGPQLFRFVLGGPWYSSGELASALVPLFTLRMASPLVMSLNLHLDRQSWNLYHNLAAVGLTVAAFAVGLYADVPLVPLIGAYAWANTLLLFFFTAMTFRRLEIGLWGMLVRTIVVLVFGFGITALGLLF